MVITCPSCSARYRLSPDKIKGRRAKITCPKCAHVFVVFSEGEDGGDEPDPSGDAVAAGPTTGSARSRDKDKDTTTGAFKAVGVGEEEVKAANTGKVRVVAPGPRKARKAAGFGDTGGALPVVVPGGASGGGAAAGSGASSAVAEPIVDEDGAPLTSSSLDFREVGITTWKVKVSIGLIYDFSDIATLKKYLSDKKVTEDDLISHNGKEWVRIGDVPDLDRHFVETWKAAKANYKGDGKTAAKKSAMDRASESGGMSSPLASGTGSASSTGASGAFPTASGNSRTASGSTGRSPSVTSPGASRPRAPGKRKAALEEAEKKGGSRAMLAVAALLFIAIAAWLAFKQKPVPVQPGPAPAAAGAAAGKAPTTEDDEIRRRIQQKVAGDMERARAEAEAAAAGQKDPEEAAEEARADLQPVRPPGYAPVRQQPGAARAEPTAAAPAPTRRNEPAPASSAAVSSPKSGSGGAGVTTTQSAEDGSNYAKVGIAALASGNFGNAAKMLKKAVDKSPARGDWWQKLGDAYSKLGESDKAAEAYRKAQEAGTPSANGG
jgi:predicted Zn finger-like uncharacterized protein